jgi:hypothetical protein
MTPVPGSARDDVVVASAADLEAVMAALVRSQRLVFVAGLPGVGKSLILREAARAASGAGRTVHLLQWDVARLAFDSPEIAYRYPERHGVTHALIRRAVGEWARGAVGRWHRQHHDAKHILIGEVPVIGNRLLELVQVQADDVEPLLAGPDAAFILPVPSIEVRSAIERARGKTFAAPSHLRERADAPPELMQRAWHEVHAHAVTLGAATLSAEQPVRFDPVAYAVVYRHLLRHRQVIMLWVNAQLEARTSVYDLNVPVRELVPSSDEAAAAVAQLERDDRTGDIEQDAARWFERV